MAAAVGPDVMTRMFRAPHGFRGPLTSRAVARLGYKTIGWSAGVFDSAQPGADVIADRVCESLSPGAIVILHDADGWHPHASRLQTAQALARICATAREHGYAPTTLGAVLAA